MLALDKPENVSNPVICALKNSKKGKLQYDRYWFEEGRTKDILKKTSEYLTKPSLNISNQGLASLKAAFSNVENGREKVDYSEKLPESTSDISLESISQSFSSTSDGDCSVDSVRKPETDFKDYDYDENNHRSCNRTLTYEENRKKEVEMKLKNRLEVMERKSEILSQASNRRSSLVKQTLLLDSQRKQRQIMEFDRMQFEEMMAQELEMKELGSKQAKRLQEKMKHAELKDKEIQQQRKEQETRAETLIRIKHIFFNLFEMVSQLLQTCEHQEHLRIPAQSRFEHLMVLRSQLELIELENHVTNENLQHARMILDRVQLLLTEISADVSNALMFAQQIAVEEAKKQIVVPEKEEPKAAPEVEPKQFVSKFESVNVNLYKELFENHRAWQELYQGFVNDSNLKKYRFDLQKAVNTPVNAISSVSGSHIRDKFERLNKLLSGQAIMMGNKSVSVDKHPMALHFCADLLAKTIVSQAECNVSSNHEAAFPLAALAISLWSKFPKIGELLLAHLFARCPYLSPKTLPKTAKTSDEALKGLGYLIINGESEDQEQFLKRMTGMVRFYAALLETPPCPQLKCESHPHGLGNGWIFLSSLLSTAPIPDVTPTILFDFLEVCGFSMSRAYGKQFHKILHVLCKDYFQAIKAATPNGTSGPLTRLEVFLQVTLRKGSIMPPVGQITERFWYT